VLFGKSATGVGDIITGTTVLVEGRLSSGTYKDKNGLTRPSTRAVAFSVIPIVNAQPDIHPAYGEQAETDDDTIPF
jgi:single-stranded DNA-binding protein